MQHPPKKAKIEESSSQRSMFRRASMDLVGMGGTVPEYGAIFMSNRKTMEECLRRKIFGLPFSKADFVKHVKVGMALFLFEYERRELHGVFQASTDGAINIIPEAYCSSGKQFSAQVRVTTIWNCTPLTEEEFSDAIRDNYFAAKKFHFGLSEDQVHRLLVLFSSKKLKQPQRQLRRSHVSEIVRKGEVINTPESGRFPRSNRVGNDHNMDNNVRPVSTAEYREKSLGKEMTFYDHFSTEIPVNRLGDARFMMSNREKSPTEIPVNHLGDARFMMSNRERSRDHLDDDPGMAFPTKYYWNSLGGARGVANVDRSQTDNDTEPVISTDYLYKPNLSRLEHSGRQPYFESSAFCSRGGTGCFDITSGFGNCASSPTPDDYGCFRPRITMPFSGPGYSKSNAVEYSDLEGYRALSFAGSSLLPVSLLKDESVGPATYSLRSINETRHDYGYPEASRDKISLLKDENVGPATYSLRSIDETRHDYGPPEASHDKISLLKDENVGPATYSLRSIDETRHDYGYPEASHDKNKQLPRSGNSEAYAANVSLSSEVQCHSQGDLCSLESERMAFHENNMSDHDFLSGQKLGGMYSARQKSRNSVFSRLTFAAEASAEENDSPVDYNEHNVDTSVDELMTILHGSSYHWAKKMRKSKPLTGHDENGENFRRKPKTVYSEMERDQGTLLLIQEINMDATLSNGESNCETAKGQPPVHFKRRSETGKSKDEIKMGGFVESPGSNGLSGTCHKRRKLVRPNFSKKEPSHEKDAIGESTPNPELSSQESSFSEDNTRKSGGALDGNHGNENKEGPEQAGLLDPFQVSSGQSGGALDRNHRNENKEGPEQAGLLDRFQVSSGALDRNHGNENKEGPEQAGLPDEMRAK